MDPLDGIRVIDFTTYVQGPAATLALADMGADVIKIESPEGDTLRSYGRRASGFSGPFESVNRGKRGLALDLRRPAALEVVERLLADADVLVQSFRPDTARRLGLDYEALAPRHPRLVHASATGYGLVGPDANEPAFDIVAGGRSGYLVATGRPEGAPRRPLPPMGDLLAAKDTFSAILLALFARERTGRGQKIVTSLLSSQIAFQRIGFTEYLHDGTLGGISHRDGFALSTWYRARDDRWVVISLLHPRFYPRLCRVLGRPDLEVDPRFRDPADRVRHDLELRAILTEEFAKRTRDEWVSMLREAEVPGGPVLDVPEVAEDAHVAAQNLWVEYEHPVHGRMRSVDWGFELGETPGGIRRAAPEIGQHSAEVLREAGFGDAEIEKLVADGVTATAPRPGA